MTKLLVDRPERPGVAESLFAVRQQGRSAGVLCRLRSGRTAPGGNGGGRAE